MESVICREKAEHVSSLRGTLMGFHIHSLWSTTNTDNIHFLMFLSGKKNVIKVHLLKNGKYHYLFICDKYFHFHTQSCFLSKFKSRN